MPTATEPIRPAISSRWNIPWRRCRRWWVPALLAAAGAGSAVSPWVTACVLVFALTFALVIPNPALGLLLFVALQPLLDRAIAIPLGRGLPDLSLGRMTVAFLLVAIVGRVAVQRVRLATVGPMEILTLAVPLGIILAAPLSEQPEAVAQSAISAFLVPLLLYFIARNCIRDQKALDALFTAVMALGVLLTFYMIFELTTGVVLYPEAGASLERLARPHTRSVPAFWLVKGLLSDSSNFARVFVTTIPVTVYLTLTRSRGSRRGLLLLATFLQGAGLFLTLSRAGWLATAVGLGIMQFTFPRLRRSLLIVTAVAAMALALYYRPVAHSLLVEKRLLYNLETLNGRLPRWRAALEMWKVKPISGWGFGRFADESGRFRADGQRQNYVSPHSDYLAILVGAGLVGFLPYLLSLLTPLAISARFMPLARAPGRSRAAGPEAIVTYWAVLFGFLLASLTTDLGQPIVRTLVFTVAGGVIGSHEAASGSVPARKPGPAQTGAP